MLGSWDQSTVRGSRGRFSTWWESWIARFGSVTHLIVGTCVVVFLLQLVCGFVGFTVGDSDRNVLDYLLGLSAPGLRQGFVWQPLTYMFLHDVHNLLHIVFNLLILWFIGREVEYFIGPKFYLRLYLCGGVVGGLLWLACNHGSEASVVGASAAVLACVIAFATLFPDRELTFLLWFIIPVTLKARYLALIFVALDVVPILQHAGGNVAHLAHLGGAAFGYIYIKHLGYGRVPRWLGAIQSAGRGLRPKPRAPVSAPTAARQRRQPDLSPEAYIRENVDPILEKISREGIHSLTAAERRILESAKDLLRKRQG